MAFPLLSSHPLGILRQEDLCAFQASPGYRTECHASLDLRVRLCLFPKEQNKVHGKEKPDLGDTGDPRCPQRLLIGEFVTLQPYFPAVLL